MPPERPYLTQDELQEIERYEERERERRLAEEDVGDDIDGIEEAYDSEEDWSFAFEDDETLVGFDGLTK